MDDSYLQAGTTRVRAITSGNADRYIARETAHLTAGERSLLGYLKTYIDWKKRQEGVLLTIPLKIATMATLQGVSKITIKRRLAGLKKAGEIVAFDHFTDNGRQLASSYAFPKMTVWLKTLTISDVVDAYTDQGAIDCKEEEQEGITSDTDKEQSGQESDISDTPIKQGSYSKKNTYTKFSKKEDFLNVTGSVRYIPRLLGIIRKMRPGADPDVIFRYFKEWISAEDFVLQPGKTFIGLLFQFSRCCKIPYFNDLKNKSKTTSPKTDTDYSSYEPEGNGLIERIRKRLFKHDPAIYRNWFYEAEISVENSILIYRGKNRFTTSHVKSHFEQLLSHTAGSEGLHLRFA